MQITLTSYEVGAGVRVGGLRHYQSVLRGIPDKSESGNAGGWSYDIEGALGEIAAAKALNLYWSGSVNSFGECDLGGIQIRTRSKAYYDLLVRPRDDENCIWVLVTGSAGTYDVVGWINGTEAKQEQWLKTPNDREPAYFIPKSALKPIETLSHADIEQVRNQQRSNRKVAGR